MKVLVYRWDIFPYDDIINELKDMYIPFVASRRLIRPGAPASGRYLTVSVPLL